MNSKQTTAGPWHRLMAYAIDAALFLVGFEVLLSRVVSAKEVSEMLNSLLWTFVLTTALYTIGYMIYTSAFTAGFGGTIGKLLTGLEIVDLNENRITFWRAFFRNYIGYMVSGLFLWLGFIWICIDKDRRGWHDMMAGSRVVMRRNNLLTLGLLTLAILITVNTMMAKAVWAEAASKSSLYKGIIQDIVGELRR